MRQDNGILQSKFADYSACFMCKWGRDVRAVLFRRFGLDFVCRGADIQHIRKVPLLSGLLHTMKGYIEPSSEGWPIRQIERIQVLSSSRVCIVHTLTLCFRVRSAP